MTVVSFGCGSRRAVVVFADFPGEDAFGRERQAERKALGGVNGLVLFEIEQRPGAGEARAADVEKRVVAEDAGQDDYDAIRYQGNYVKELIAETDYPSFDVDGANEAFFQWKKHKKTDIMTFRNNSYRSAITGTMAPAHHTQWKDALDDSLEGYLQN